MNDDYGGISWWGMPRNEPEEEPEWTMERPLELIYIGAMSYTLDFQATAAIVQQIIDAQYGTVVWREDQHCFRLYVNRHYDLILVADLLRGYADIPDNGLCPLGTVHEWIDSFPNKMTTETR